MKTLFNSLGLIAILFSLSANAQFVDQARDDASFISAGFQSNQECYSLKVGSTVFTEQADKEISMMAARQAVSNEITAVSGAGCVAVDQVTYTGLHIVYNDDTTVDYPAEMMQNLRDHNPSAERLLHNAKSVEIKDLKVIDVEGGVHAVPTVLIIVE